MSRFIVFLALLAAFVVGGYAWLTVQARRAALPVGVHVILPESSMAHIDGCVYRVVRDHRGTLVLVPVQP